MWQHGKLVTMLVLVGLVGLPGASFAKDVVVSGSWTLVIDATNLTGGAGSDLSNPYESGPSQVLLSVLNTPGHGGNHWRVDVRRQDLNWPGTFQLELRRTGKGTGNGNLSGGLAYQTLTLLDTEFISGVWQRIDVPLQFRLSGLSVRVPAGTYVTNVMYTVVDL